MIALRSLLQVLVRTAEKHPLIVVFDEFSASPNVDGAAGLLRTELQHHYQQTRHRVRGVAAVHDAGALRRPGPAVLRPGRPRRDRPADDASLGDIVKRGFESTGRRAGSVVERVVHFSRGHPQRAMQMADAAVAAHPRGGEADDELWADALEAVRTSVDSGSERLYELIPTGQQKTLRAVVGGGSVYGAVADVLDLSPGTAKGAVDALLGNGYMARRNGKLVVVDPLFADWIRRRFAP